MKIALIECKKDRPNSINNNMVNNRNMVILSEYLNAKYIHNTNVIDVDERFDAMLFGFNSFSNDIDNTLKLINNNPAAKLFWLVGEYEQSNYWALHKSKRRFNVIKNFDGYGKISGRERIDNFYDLNINLLISRQPNNPMAKGFDCVYYSRWRAGRSKYLKEYLQSGVYFSSDSKNFKKHKHIGCNPTWIKKLSWSIGKETLNNFRYSLYIEDEYTHRVFNNLANRWYEAGFCNNVVFFDRNCLGTIRKSEIAQFENEMEPYLVSTHAELLEKIEICNKDFNHHLETQKRWRADELRLRAEMLDELRRIINQ